VAVKAIEQHTDLIAHLNDVPIANFGAEVKRLVRDDGYRMSLPDRYGIHISEALPRMVYLCSERLDLKPGAVLPGAGIPGTTVNVFEVGIDNLLQFKINHVELANADGVMLEPQRRQLLNALGDSVRTNRPINHNEETEEAVETVVTQNASKATTVGTNGAKVEVVGNKLRVTVPGGLKGHHITCRLNGYNANGSIRDQASVQHKNIDAGTTIYLELNGLCGHCRVELEEKMTPYQETLEFDGPRIKQGYTKRTPKLFGRSKKVDIDSETYEFKKVVFALSDKEAPAVGACINPTAEGQRKVGFRYPIGEGTSWTVWVPEDVLSTAILEAHDEKNLYELEEE